MRRYVYLVATYLFFHTSCFGQIVPGDKPALLTQTDIHETINHFITNQQPTELVHYLNSLAPLSFNTQSFIQFSEALHFFITTYPRYIEENPLLLKPLANALYTIGINASFYRGEGTYDPEDILTLQRIASGLNKGDPTTRSIQWSIDQIATLLQNFFTDLQSPLIAGQNKPPYPNPTTNRPSNPVSKQPASWGFIPKHPQDGCNTFR